MCGGERAAGELERLVSRAVREVRLLHDGRERGLAGGARDAADPRDGIDGFLFPVERREPLARREAEEQRVPRDRLVSGVGDVEVGQPLLELAELGGGIGGGERDVGDERRVAEPARERHERRDPACGQLCLRLLQFRFRLRLRVGCRHLALRALRRRHVREQRRCGRG